MKKKYFIFATMSAIALAGTLSLTSCSADEVVDEPVAAEDNPTYDPVAKTVTAQFVLNVSSATSGVTRQSATIAQKNGNFRGMQDAKLIGLTTGNSSWLAPFAGGATTTDWTATTGTRAKTYDLGTLYGASAVNNTGTNNADNSSRRIVELTLPLQTDAMLVYARAIPSGTDEENGKVAISIPNNPENITFDLVSRLGDKQTSYNETCSLAALIINRILKSEVASAAAGAYTHKAHTITLPLCPLSHGEELAKH